MSYGWPPCSAAAPSSPWPIAVDSAPAVAQIDVEAAVPQPRLNTFEEQTRALRESLGLPIKEER